MNRKKIGLILLICLAVVAAGVTGLLVNRQRAA